MELYTKFYSQKNQIEILSDRFKPMTVDVRDTESKQYEVVVCHESEVDCLPDGRLIFNSPHTHCGFHIGECYSGWPGKCKRESENPKGVYDKVCFRSKKIGMIRVLETFYGRMINVVLGQRKHGIIFEKVTKHITEEGHFIYLGRGKNEHNDLSKKLLVEIIPEEAVILHSAYIDRMNEEGYYILRTEFPKTEDWLTFFGQETCTNNVSVSMADPLVEVLFTPNTMLALLRE